jgi:phage protein D
MAQTNQLASQITIKVNGTEIERGMLQKLLEAVVDQHTHLPDMFTLRFHDPGLELLDGKTIDLTKEVEISAATTDGVPVTLIQGEITALEPDFGEGMDAEFVVRGYDQSHSLYREIKSQAFLNKKDSDLADHIARTAGLSAEVETTKTVYDHIFQHNLSDLTFLTQRAWRIGFECFVSEKKLYFRKPPDGKASLSSTWGQDLLSFQLRMSLAEQVDEVTVRGWDVQKKEAIVGRAENGKLFPEIEASKDGTAATTFGKGKLVIVNQPVVSQAEANTLAAARMNELSGALIEAEGMAFRRPDIQAGRVVELKSLGQRFSGKYLVTSATHLYNAEGLMTTFQVCGTRTGLFTDQLNGHAPLERWPGAVTAIVTNTEDPKNWGRVKVKFPWMTDEAESDWARVVGPGGGPKAGLFALPEVNDEVLVVFEHGDFNRPFVLGGLWNGKDAVPPKSDSAGKGQKALIRTWCSRKGHRFTVYDTPDNKIEVETAGKHQLVLDDANKKITLTSGSGSLKVTLDDNGKKITIDSSGEIEIKAGSNLKLQAKGNLDVQAAGQVNVKGATVNLNS